LKTAFEITKKPNESAGERGRYVFFQLLWDASDFHLLFLPAGSLIRVRFSRRAGLFNFDGGFNRERYAAEGAEDDREEFIHSAFRMCCCVFRSFGVVLFLLAFFLLATGADFVHGHFSLIFLLGSNGAAAVGDGTVHECRKTVDYLSV